MFKKTPLASAISCVTVASALSAGGALPAFAASDQIMEEVVVTGSRIKRADFSSNAPVATVASEQIDLTGTVNTESLLNTLPQLVPGLDRTSNNPGGGYATVNLRGLGEQRTLVLVDSTRMVPTTRGGIVDINTIPTALIDRVEVLTGGASAVYGSDAVAGVINFILKDDFEGAELSIGTEQTGKGDANIDSVNLTVGANSADGNGNVVLNLSWAHRAPLFQGDRDFANFAQFDGTDSSGNPILYNGGSPGIPQTLVFAGNFPLFNTDGSIRPFVSTGDPNDYYNYAPVNYIQLPQERYQATALGHYQFSDNVEVYGRGMFTSSTVPQQLAPTPAYGTFTWTLDGSPFITPAAQAELSGNNTDAVGVGDRLARVFSDGGSAFTPTNTCLNCVFDSDLTDTDTRLNVAPLVDTDGDGVADTATAFIGRRMLEVGPRISDDEFFSFLIQGGVRGQIADTSWSYDAYVQAGAVRDAATQFGNINTDRLQQALRLDLVADPTGGTCQDPSANGGTTGCTPANIFGENNMSQASADYVETAVASVLDYKQDVYAVNFDGDLFELPGGTAGAAFGFEHIDNSAEFRPSQDLAASTIAGFNGSPASAGGYHVNSYYGEVRLPILSGAAMAEDLSVELAYRASDYTTAGTVDSYKIAASWAPINQVRFRAGFNTAVRAPSILELYTPQGENFPGAIDPCSAAGSPDATVTAICVATGVPAAAVGTAALNVPAGQVKELTGGNPGLKEESADTYTIGVVVTPDAIAGLTVTVDYFDIQIDDAITDFGGGANNVLSVCYDPADPAGGAGSAFCNVVNRRSSGAIDYVSITQQNVASLKVNGVDVLATYALDVLNGSLRIDYIGTFTQTADLTAYVGAAPIECAGRFGLDCGNPTPKYKHRMTFNWSRDDWTAQVLWRLIGSTDDDDDGTVYFVENIGTKHYFDAVVAYQFAGNYQVTFGIDNLLDSDPPILGDNQEQTNTYPATYDVFGRTFYVTGKMRF